MASNSFGSIFRITTWGESHGKAIGVVLDGCPAGLDIDVEEINIALARRAPGNTAFTSPRKEQDRAEILSGLFEGKTTGAPISILIPNQDADSSKYESIKDVLRPGHANYTYLEKYGIYDYKGGGRASARETACRVAAGAIAKKLLKYYKIELSAYITQIGKIHSQATFEDLRVLNHAIAQSPVFCPDPQATADMCASIEEVKKLGDSLGGVVEFVAEGLPAGFGDPTYEKLEAKLAHAMLTLPATKGFEMGAGFSSTAMQGSAHNDIFIHHQNQVRTQTNFAGGTLGGISTGMPIIGRVAFKPTSSIMKQQKTLSSNRQETSFQMPEGSRHDPCVAIRAVPIVEAMLALVLVDSMLLNRCVVL